MSQLRWILLILGGVFVIALALWERLRPRQARGRDVREGHAPNEPTLGALGDEHASGVDAAQGEPWIGDVMAGDVPRHDEQPPAPSGVPSAAPADPRQSLPTVIIEESPDTADTVDTADLAVPVLQPASSAAQAEVDWARFAEGVGPVRTLDAPAPTDEPDAADASVPGPSANEPPVIPTSESALRVQWPPEAERHIVALRLTAGTERFSGRTLRLALAAEGFRLGRFDIFHKPDDQGQAVLSAASLTRPGTFDLTAMDGQRFAGLNLFAVLPGPLPPPAALEALLVAAEHLNERLQGEVQDERGEILTEDAIARLRETLPEGADGAVS